jgi:hypothetical protein
VQEARPGWQKAVTTAELNKQEGERLLADLRQIIRELPPHDGAAMAAAITLAEYKPPRPNGKPPAPGMLFVVVPENYRGQFIGGKGARVKEYERRLGVTVGIHGNRGRQ